MFTQTHCGDPLDQNFSSSACGNKFKFNKVKNPKKKLRRALAGNRTRINCLEGNYADHYTTNALMSSYECDLNVTNMVDLPVVACVSVFIYGFLNTSRHKCLVEGVSLCQQNRYCIRKEIDQPHANWAGKVLPLPAWSQPLSSHSVKQSPHKISNKISNSALSFWGVTLVPGQIAIKVSLSPPPSQCLQFRYFDHDCWRQLLVKRSHLVLLFLLLSLSSHAWGNRLTTLPDGIFANLLLLESLWVKCTWNLKEHVGARVCMSASVRACTWRLLDHSPFESHDCPL